MIFSKYHGTGNDFIMVDNRTANISLLQQQIEHLCHRRFGIGADGLILLENGTERLTMVYYNSDGRQSSMCGNGGRCFARFAQDLGLVKNDAVEFDAIDGWHQANFEGDDVFLQMKNCDGFSISDDGFVLDTGSPHFVKFVPSDFWEDEEFVHTARTIRNRPQFIEKGINVNYISEVEKGKLKIRTFERGVEDETYSCGTGVTAAALVYGSQHDLNEVKLESKGGNLSVSFNKNLDGIFTDVFLKGPAVKVFDGEIIG